MLQILATHTIPYAIEVPEICREEGVSICWDSIQVVDVSCLSSAVQSSLMNEFYISL